VPSQLPPEGQPPDPREGEDFFLNVARKLDNPFPDFDYFRKNRPVFYFAPLKAWYLFRYDDVSALFRDPRLSSDRMKGFVDLAPVEVRDGLRTIAPYLESWMLMKDGLEHSRIRNHIQPGLTPAVVQHLAGVIRQSADELLDQAIQQGRLDACADYAFLLPAYVLSDLFGVRNEDRRRVVQWSVAFIDFFNIEPITTDTSRRLIDNGLEMIAYTKELLAGCRDNRRSAFLSLVAADQSGADGLTADEIAGNVMLLLLAGHVAVRNLIGNALYLLLTHPEQFAKLKADPALLHPVVEETLRYEPPVTLIPRVAAEDFSLHGSEIKKGQVVQLSIASANRDAAHFPDGERFDITRPPGKHLSFGAGPHGCFGAALAREIAAIGLEVVLGRMPGLKLDPSREIRWYRNAANRGPINLPVMTPP
jgi:cytochrome P450